MLSRRGFVAAAATGLGAFLTGCTGSGGDETAGATTRATAATGVASTGFTWDTPGGTDYRPADGPTVRFAAPNGVTVAGALRYGSSSCDRIALDDVTLDGGTLRVRVRSASVRDEPEACTDDLAAADYRVTVTLDGGLPETVAVTEVPAVADARTYTAAPD